MRGRDVCEDTGQRVVSADGKPDGLERLYSSLLATWRRQRQEGLTPKKRGRKALAVDPRVKKLEQENARLVRKLKQADAIIAFQKKVHELLGIPLKPFESEEED